MAVIKGHKPLSIKTINKARKSICKITSMVENSPIVGTGFFMSIANSLRYLVTCQHLLRYAIEKKSKICLEIYGEKIYELELNGRSIKILDHLKDIVAIEIKDSDSICKDIEFLEYDKNYIKGYSIYRNAYLFSVQYYENDIVCLTGGLKNIENSQFFHSLSTGRGSGGSPILLYSNHVIGIHLGSVKSSLNFGTFIGELIKEFDMPNQLNLDKNSQSRDKNKIFANINNSKINNKINNSKINTNTNKNNINTNFNKNFELNKNIDNTKNNNINNIEDSSNNNNNIINNKIELTLDLTKSKKITNNIKEDSKETITFYIKSINQLLNCKVTCKSSDKFNTIMNIIFEKEPSFIEEVGFFVCNGNKVNEYKTIKENEIKNNDVVLMNNLE